VAQEPVLFSASVADNIAMGVGAGEGVAQPTRDDVQAAARAANAHDFVTALPEGYDTLVTSAQLVRLCLGVGRWRAETPPAL
jgi:ABC-type multidrug transport system fused ATPase/permease subunit